ncbi:MAG: hypothetical protein WA718_21280 [Terriglobales bacterium]
MFAEGAGGWGAVTVFGGCGSGGPLGEDWPGRIVKDGVCGGGDEYWFADCAFANSESIKAAANTQCHLHMTTPPSVTRFTTHKSCKR